ncbi:MAG: hypothetical protein KatS3mg128_0095 [Silanimonas sp.]|nr:MAG: hypothetical protein KatS3mg128_0095 [Silanimonas sp.]
MPTIQRQFLLTEARPSGHRRLAISFADGFRAEVDLGLLILRYPALSRLRHRRVFEDVALDEWQRGVVFGDDDALALASDNLRALAVEQAGGCSHEQLMAWMDRHGLTLDTAAEALGVSRRMLAYYRSGAKPIPKTVALAMLGWEVGQKPRAA